jgi:two-component system repressor protein LuxO
MHAEQLKAAGFAVSAFEDLRSTISALAQTQAPVAIVDLSLPDETGLEILSSLKAMNAGTSLIAISKDGSLKRAITAMKLGAFDYLPEPFEPERLVAMMLEAVGETAGALPRMPENGLEGFDFERGGASSPAMQDVCSTIEKAAGGSAAIFITGESGTGKEICAHAIHSCSARRSQPFVAMNCAAIPANLVASEIFGHAKGAFSGAVTNRPGLATEAHGGTLFLNEVCDLTPDVQAKLLRLIQNDTFQRIGNKRLEEVDVRIVCATSHDPEQEVKQGRFSEDLFQLLNAIPIALPPLRERSNDMMQIARHFLFGISAKEGRSFKPLTPDAETGLRDQNWPSGVRGLQDALQNAITLDHDRLISTPARHPGDFEGDLPDTGQDARSAGKTQPLEKMQRAAIIKALQNCDNNVVKAAAQLGIGASTISRKKAEWEAEEQTKAGKTGR